jgi:hypothetical protein
MAMMAPTRLDPPYFIGPYEEEPLDLYSTMILELSPDDPKLKPLENMKIYFSQFR